MKQTGVKQTEVKQAEVKQTEVKQTEGREREEEGERKTKEDPHYSGDSPIKCNKQKYEKCKMHFDVFGSLQLFLTCNVDVAVSGVLFLHQKNQLGEVPRGPGRPKYLLDILGGSQKNGGSEIVFVHSSQRGDLHPTSPHHRMSKHYH